MKLLLLFVAMLCPSLCDPVDSSMPGLPVLHHLWSLLKLMSIESMMPSNHLNFFTPIFSCPQSFPASGSFPMRQLFASRWPKYWSFSFSISPSNEYSGLISFRIDWFDLLFVQRFSRVFSSTTIQKNQFFSSQPSLWSNSHIHT